jgi:hypothetical protein
MNDRISNEYLMINATSNKIFNPSFTQSIIIKLNQGYLAQNV